MGQPQSGPGLGLPLPQNLYPSELMNAPYDQSSNKLSLAPGESIVIPTGSWYVDTGMYCVLQYLDPINNTWVMAPNSAWGPSGVKAIVSDGFTVRIANLLGCPISAVVAVLGSAYVQSTTTVVATGNNSTWVPIVGGALAVSGATLVSNGAGYGVAPLVLIPPPAPPSNNPNGVGGIAAAGYATIASGTVSGFTFTCQGAGYQTAPIPVIVPSPFDPNLSTGITAATLAFTLTGAGALMGALCTNSGAPIATVPNGITLTVAGAGSSGSLTANVLYTATSATVVGTGLGFGTISALMSSVGGVPNSGSIAASPYSLGLAWRPRPTQVGLTVTAIGTLSAQAGTIYDGGLFLGSTAPGAVVAINPSPTGVSLSGSTQSFGFGTRPDIVTLQPSP